MRTFVLGDIHGAYKALQQCLDRSQFNFEKDSLIFLGDVADRGPQSSECVDLLLEVKHLIALLGNHDIWVRDWLDGSLDDLQPWLNNGGQETFDSYTRNKNFEEIQALHLESFYKKMIPYYKDDQNRVFVHAGFNWRKPIELTDSIRDYSWDRTLVKQALSMSETPCFPPNQPYKEIYVGHTPTHRLAAPHNSDVPLHLGNLWCMDQGAGWGKKLSIMDIDSKEYYQSDLIDP